MANNTDTPHRPPTPTAPARARDAPEAELRGTGARQTMRARMEDKYAEDADAWARQDEAAYNRATVGIPDADTLDKVLALGGDATRASPDPAQSLDDAEPGFTTTTGAHRTPIDPTTAAVPAPPNSAIAMKLRGTPTIGSREPDTPEELWQERDVDMSREALDKRAEEREKEADKRATDRQGKAAKAPSTHPTNRV